ncbi:MAG: beta-lactamase family protein [Pseudomonadales bacterium]|nr:beta-lactamase family protein [Pseudomonadales bacterium]MBO6597256.1 beta-lactamase family protein [Pseudomonadales bacterium]MBO6655238.1 beta-lactamase family protein [Pseudomonadales bacterium]MBO6823558.1 beta-lactamase family protein [Pseudomonadales bacterium]
MMPLFAAIILVLSASSLLADSIQPIEPEAQGVSADRLERLKHLGQRYVDEGKLAGIITMVNRGGRLVHAEVTGQRGVDDDRPLEIDHLFRIYSMTKPITAVAAMQLYEQGGFSLNDPLSKYVPELKDLKVWNEQGDNSAPKQEITMHHLLTHTAGFSYGFNPGDPVDQMYREARLFEADNLTDFAVQLAKLPLRYEPGERWHYSVAVDITGLVVERISGMRFDEYLAANIFEPLGMEDTFFEVPQEKMDRFLPNHYWDRSQGKLGTVDESQGGGLASYTGGVTLFSGGGGLVSTVHDYMRFAEMLRNGGEFQGARIIGPKTLKFMTKNHLPEDITQVGTGERLNRAFAGMGFGLGFGVILDPLESRAIGSAGTFMWGGAAGTVFWVDPLEDLVVIGMIQLMGSPWPLREELRIYTYQALIESNE